MNYLRSEAPCLYFQQRGSCPLDGACPYTHYPRPKASLRACWLIALTRNTNHNPQSHRHDHGPHLPPPPPPPQPPQAPTLLTVTVQSPPPVHGSPAVPREQQPLWQPTQSGNRMLIRGTRCLFVFFFFFMDSSCRAVSHG